MLLGVDVAALLNSTNITVVSAVSASVRVQTLPATIQTLMMNYVSNVVDKAKVVSIAEI